MLSIFRKTKRIPPPRQVLVTDKVVQGALLRRLALYAASGLLYFTIIELLEVALADPTRSRTDIAWAFFGEAIYWAPGLVVLIPVFAYDLLRTSNRFAGPVVRMRAEMRQLTAGGSIEPIEFRGDDYLQGMAEEFNELREEVIKLRERIAAVPASDSAAPVRKGSLFGRRKGDKANEAETSTDDLLESVGV